MAGSSPSTESTSFKTEGLLVLLIDSDVRSLASVARMLVNFSYEVVMAKTARAALSILSNPESKFDLVLTDTHLSDIHGFVVIEEAISKKVPIITMSSYEDPMSLVMALRNGATFALEKPLSSFDVNSLWMHVAREVVKAARNEERKRNNSLEEINGNSHGAI